MKPGRELDALIAEKIMGWRRVGPDEPPKSGWRSSTGYWHAEEDNAWEKGLPRYSTDIAAAWDVVDKIKDIKPDHAFSLESYKGKWSADFVLKDYDNYNCGEGASSAPLAICLAALRATE